MEAVPHPPRADEHRDPGALLGEVLRLSTQVSQLLARALGVSMPDLAALHHLVGRPPLGPAELGRRLGMTTASATVLVDRLQQSGYLRRRPDPADRRRIVLEVTEHTAMRSLQAVAPLTEAITALGETLDEPTRQAITTYLADVAAIMRAFVESNPVNEPS